MRLRPYTEQDRALTVALESDPRVMGHLGGPVEVPDATRVHETRMAQMADGDLFYAILRDDDPQPVGLIAVWRSEWEGTPIHEIGLMLVPGHQSRGLAAEAVRELVPRAREHGVGRLHAFIAVTNEAGQIAADRAEFHRIADCDMSYHDRPIRCAHWIRDL
jgi:RimJ/RimL family protein N-acetyltransferase